MEATSRGGKLFGSANSFYFPDVFNDDHGSVWSFVSITLESRECSCHVAGDIARSLVRHVPNDLQQRVLVKRGIADSSSPFFLLMRNLLSVCVVQNIGCERYEDFSWLQTESIAVEQCVWLSCHSRSERSNRSESSVGDHKGLNIAGTANGAVAGHWIDLN